MNHNPDSKPSSDVPSNGRNAGGCFMAVGSILGVVVGSVTGQPTIGLLAGLAIGGLAAVAVWLTDR